MRYSLIAIALSLSAGAWHHGDQKDVEYGKLADLDIEILTTQNEIYPGEPFLVSVMIQNKTDKPILLDLEALRDFTWMRNHLVIRADKGEKDQYFALGGYFGSVHHMARPQDEIKYESFGTGRKYVIQDLLFSFSKHLYPFYNVGEYQVKYQFQQTNATTHMGEDVVSRNVLKINVKKPSGDNEILSNIFQNEGKFSIYYPTCHYNTPNPTGGKMPSLEELISKYPDTSFTQHVRYLLARSQDDKDAVKTYEEIIKDESYVLTPWCVVDLAHCYRQTGEHEKARKLVEDLMKKFKNHPALGLRDALEGKFCLYYMKENPYPYPWTRYFSCFIMREGEHNW